METASGQKIVVKTTMSSIDKLSRELLNIGDAFRKLSEINCASIRDLKQALIGKYDCIIPDDPPWRLFKKYWSAWCGAYAKDIIENIVKPWHGIRTETKALISRRFNRKSSGRQARTFQNLRFV